MINWPLRAFLFFLMLAFIQPLHGYVFNLYSNVLVCLGVLSALVGFFYVKSAQQLSFSMKTGFITLGGTSLVIQSALAGAYAQDLYGFIVYVLCLVFIALLNDRDATLEIGSFYKDVTKALIIAGFLVSIESILIQYHLVPGINFIVSSRINGPMGQPNLLGLLLVVSLFATAYLTIVFTRFHVIFAICAVVLGFVIAGTGSRAAFLMETIGCCLYLAAYAKKVINHRMLYVFCALILGHLIFWSITTNVESGINREFVSNRWVELHKALQVFVQNPWGIGYDRFGQHSQWMMLDVMDQHFIQGPLVLHCHNLIGQVVAEFGLVGFILLVAYVVVMLRGFIKLYKQDQTAFLFAATVSIAFAINAFTEYALWNLDYGMLFFLVNIPVLFKGMGSFLRSIELPKVVLGAVVVLIGAGLLMKIPLLEMNLMNLSANSNQEKVAALQRATEDKIYGKTYQLYLIALIQVNESNLQAYDALTTDLIQWRPYDMVILRRIEVCLDLKKYVELPLLIKLALKVNSRNQVPLEQLLNRHPEAWHALGLIVN